MKQADLQKLAEHANEYIAVTTKNTDIIASGKTIKELEKKLEKQKIKNIIIQYVPPVDKFLSPVCR